MPTPTISIAMATYNGGKYLPQQLESIARQSLQPLELVICDDRSRDHTPQILSDFAARADCDVVVKINDENVGYIKNFIQCAKMCRGDIIVFCDQDDVWHENKLQMVSDYFANSDDIALSHDCVIINADGSIKIASDHDYLAMSGFTPVVNIKGCCMAYRRKLIDLVGYPATDDTWGHDNWISFVAYAFGLNGILKAPLIDYRLHDTNTSGYLPGGKSRFQKLLRSLKVFHFSSGSLFEEYVAHFMRANDIEKYYAALRQCAPAMPQARTQHAYRAIANREKVWRLRGSRAYRSPVQRIPQALQLFLAGAYRSAEGLLGLVEDLCGQKAISQPDPDTAKAGV